MKQTKYARKYWHIKKFNLLPILGIILFLFLAIGNYNLIDKEVISEAFSCGTYNCNFEFKDLSICYTIIAEYIFISLFVISIVALIKRGYGKLKRHDEESLIVGLISGLIGGLIFGLMGGLIVGLIFGLIGGLIGGLIFGLIFEF